MNPWFRITNIAEDPSVVDIHVSGFIGSWGEAFFGPTVTAASFVEQLEALPDAVKTIRVRIDSPGGDMFAGVTIANALRSQRTEKGRTVETFVDSLAASAASLIMVAGDPVRIADNALVFLHNPETFTFGNAEVHEKAAQDLRTIRVALIATYRWRTPLSDKEIGVLLDQATWLDADEAIAKGFATEKITGIGSHPEERDETVQAAYNRFGSRVLASRSLPARLRPRIAALVGSPKSAPQTASVDQVFALCRQAGVSDFAESIITAKATLGEAKTLIAAETAARATAKERAKEIQAICELADGPQFAAGYIDSNISVATVRSHMTNMAALRDNVEIDTSLNEGGLSGRPRKRNPINRAAIYDRMNGRLHQEDRRG